MPLESSYLASLRRRHRCELILLLVQLEQLIPGWWESLVDLAEQLGTERSTLNQSLITLEQHNLIRRCSNSNNGGTWIWWVKTSSHSQASPKLEPCWILWDSMMRTTERIPVTSRQRWAQQHGIAYSTLRGFLSGRQLTLKGRWTIKSTPLD